MQILNIAGYKFTDLPELNTLRANLRELCQRSQLKGTILLSHEGINISLAGEVAQIKQFMEELNQDTRFQGISFHQTFSASQPFRYLKIKLKKEIITMKQPGINPMQQRAAGISPLELKQKLDNHQDLTLLDTRNDYEVEFGTFSGAVNLHLNDFSEFPNKIADIDKNKPIVMFCTGGIRCEKAALYLEQAGFNEVYQLDGGILGYFRQVGGEHYQGSCFVFDERISLDHDLKPITT